MNITEPMGDSVRTDWLTELERENCREWAYSFDVTPSQREAIYNGMRATINAEREKARATADAQVARYREIIADHLEVCTPGVRANHLYAALISLTPEPTGSEPREDELRKRQRIIDGMSEAVRDAATFREVLWLRPDLRRRLEAVLAHPIPQEPHR